MILGAKWIITRDGKTVLEDQAVRIDEFGKIAQTSVRDCYSPHGVCRTLKMSEDKGFITIPRITHVGEGMCMSGGHCWDEVVQVDGPWEIRKEICKQYSIPGW